MVVPNTDSLAQFPVKSSFVQLSGEGEVAFSRVDAVGQLNRFSSPTYHILECGNGGFRCWLLRLLTYKRGKFSYKRLLSFSIHFLWMMQVPVLYSIIEMGEVSLLDRQITLFWHCIGVPFLSTSIWLHFLNLVK